MGRAPCCDKANVKKGPWSPEEDAKLKAYIEQNGTGGNWIALPQKIGLKRCGKSCRLRWLNYLRPNIKHGCFSEEEDNIICSLYISIGSRWSIIAAQLPGRTDNDIKNYWNTRLKKKLLGKQRKEQAARRAGLRQEIKREGQSFISPDFINPPAAYWPELPSSSSPLAAEIMPAVLMHPNQIGQEFLDQESSLKNLLIKLGGRFSDESNQESSNMTNNIYPLDQQYANSINMLSSSAAGSMNSTDSSCSQLPNANYTANGAAGTSMFQGNNGFPVDELDELLMYNDNQQQLEAHQLEGGFYGMEMANGASSGESSNCWANASSFQAYPPQIATDYEPFLQSLPQDNSSFEVSSYYFGSQ